MKVTWSFTVIMFFVLVTSTCVAQIKSVPENSPKPSIFSNADFEIALGTEWKRRDTQEYFEWEDEKNMQEIIISVLTTNEPMDSQKRLTTAKSLMEIRQKAINDIADGKASLTKVETIENDGGTELIVSGVDNNDGLQIYTSVIVRPTRAVTFAYYKYPPTLTDEGFRTKSKEMRSALKVH